MTNENKYFNKKIEELIDTHLKLYLASTKTIARIELIISVIICLVIVCYLMFYK